LVAAIRGTKIAKVFCFFFSKKKGLLPYDGDWGGD
jgi:hypothetical protein